MSATGGLNLATKYSSKVDERFYKESQAMLALNNDYEFKGDKTVKIFSLPVVAMTDYTRSGSSRYGTPIDLNRSVQTCTVTKDRAFTFIIDKGDKIQSEMVSDAGKALSRELREVCVPEFDTYVFKTLCAKAQALGNYSSTTIDKTNAYACLLAGEEHMGNFNVPDKGRVAFCSYAFANFLMQDPAFIKYGNQSQEMVIRGVLGEVDGVKIVKVASGRLPAGAAFLLTHSIAATAPKQLEEYRIHDNPPGISGWLVEGRFIYDCFVLDEKANAIWYHGGQAVLKAISIVTMPSESGKCAVTIVPGVHDANGVKWYYDTASTLAGLPTVTAGTAITTSDWTELTSNGLVISSTDGYFIKVVEVDSSSKPLGVGTAITHIAT